MIGVISFLGMQGLQDALGKRLGKSGIRFLCGDCQSEAALLMELERSIGECDVILLNSGVVQGGNMDGVLNEIRSLSADVRIVLILSGMRKQYVSAQLDEYKNRYMVSDIIFEGTGIDLNALSNVLSKGKMTENEILVGAELREEYETTKENSTCNTIGVFGTAHGAGATNMAITLSEYFAAYGSCVKTVDLTGTASLSFVKGKAIYLTQRRQDLKEIKATCDFLIYDFGVPFTISPKGDFLGLAQDYSLDMIHELKRCGLKVAMGLLDDWQVKKAQYFWQDEKWKRIVGNDYVFLFDREPAALKKTYGHINMFQRNDPAFADIISKLFLNGGMT